MTSGPRWSWPERIVAAVRLWGRLAVIALDLRRRPLPAVVAGLGRGRGRPIVVAAPPHLSYVVDRVLRAGPYQPRCLLRAAVLYSLLCDLGARPRLVLGLPAPATDHRAHAWVDLDGVDLGPRPGGADHVEIARYS